MIGSKGARKFVLTAHIVTSVGWLGAVLAYLALDLTAVSSRDVDMVRAAYASMALITWYVIVPLALASLLIGVVQALNTPWGLFRHYWVVFKLVLTVGAAVLLLQYTQTVGSLASQAMAVADPRDLPGTLLHSVGAVVVLVAITILSVYKPRGLTKHGWRRQREQQRQPE